MLYEHCVVRAANISGSFNVKEYLDLQKEVKDTLTQNWENVVHELEEYLYLNIRVMATVLPERIKTFMVPFEEEYPIGYYIAPSNSDYDQFVYRCMVPSPMPYEAHKFRWLLQAVDNLPEFDRDRIYAHLNKNLMSNGFEAYRSGMNPRYSDGLIKPFRSLNVRIVGELKKVRLCET